MRGRLRARQWDSKINPSAKLESERGAGTKCGRLALINNTILASFNLSAWTISTCGKEGSTSVNIAFAKQIHMSVSIKQHVPEKTV
jgi:hypothetical protein